MLKPSFYLLFGNAHFFKSNYHITDTVGKGLAVSSCKGLSALFYSCFYKIIGEYCKYTAPEPACAHIGVVFINITLRGQHLCGLVDLTNMRICKVLGAYCIGLHIPCIRLHFALAVILRKLFYAVVDISPAAGKLFRKANCNAADGAPASAVRKESFFCNSFSLTKPYNIGICLYFITGKILCNYKLSLSLCDSSACLYRNRSLIDIFKSCRNSVGTEILRRIVLICNGCVFHNYSISFAR